MPSAPEFSTGGSMYQQRRHSLLGTVAPFAIGAGLMYFLDPSRGRRRRALVRDKTRSTWRQLQDTAEKTRTDLTNRARGLIHEARSSFSLDAKPVAPGLIVERIRARLGRVVSHPHAISVEAV